jgi:predicted transcriptional regulator
MAGVSLICCKAGLVLCAVVRLLSVWTDEQGRLIPYQKVIPLDIEGPAMATSIKIDDELKSRIQHLAGLRQRSSHWIMREAIAQYVDREEAREGFKQEALASWAAYQETGRHLTGQETRAWLNTWGSKAEAELPECHD